MLSLSRYAGFVFGAVVLLTGCKGKDGEPGPAGLAGGNQTGSIVGFVGEVVDEFGRKQAQSGVTVTIENTSPAIATTTDANGRYELAGVKSGTYNIAFTKAGFGTAKAQGYPHVGGDQPTLIQARPQLIGVSATTVTAVSIGSATSGPGNDYTVPVTIALANPNLSGQPSSSLLAMVFVSNSANVTYLTGVFAGFLSPSGYSNPLTRTALNQRGFATGSTAYAIFYGAPNYNYGYSYVDLTTGRGIYSCLSTTPSRVVPFVVP